MGVINNRKRANSLLPAAGGSGTTERIPSGKEINLTLESISILISRNTHSMDGKDAFIAP